MFGQTGILLTSRKYGFIKSALKHKSTVVGDKISYMRAVDYHQNQSAFYVLPHRKKQSNLTSNCETKITTLLDNHGFR